MGMERTFITSNIPLVADNNYLNLSRCEIQFKILSSANEAAVPGLGNLFLAEYQNDHPMLFREFIGQFPQHFPQHLGSVDDRLIGKVVFQEEEEASGMQQTANSAWEKFNGKTRMKACSTTRRHTGAIHRLFSRISLTTTSSTPRSDQTPRLSRRTGRSTRPRTTLAVRRGRSPRNRCSLRWTSASSLRSGGPSGLPGSTWSARKPRASR